ncbi:hypothetical protein AKJ50_01960 [candidate division MSBL1 archaeon SCGC-AAA382A13]|uniref:Uncharacterized protein n=1 Tax=candidate division MSBL1 archaeon SCGC-AAA382A13 TaxID=1698279 RepID=A0A133VEI3_9EURY|nr:hypothetical protein AKJ50_01960 [candidate division MSBL1 archaeon SCGC-AAA382A13]
MDRMAPPHDNDDASNATTTRNENRSRRQLPRPNNPRRPRHTPTNPAKKKRHKRRLPKTVRRKNKTEKIRQKITTQKKQK